MSENTKLLSSELREQRLARITNAVEPDLELILEKVTPQTFELHPMLCERAGVPVGHQVTYEWAAWCDASVPARFQVARRNSADCASLSGCR